MGHILASDSHFLRNTLESEFPRPWARGTALFVFASGQQPGC